MSSRLNIDALKIKYIGAVYNYLTVIDVIRDNNCIMFVCKCKCGVVKQWPKSKVINGHTKSCGCYRNSKEYKENNKQWLKDDQKRLERNAKCRQWCNNNKDKLAERGKRHSQWFKDNTDKVKELSDKHSQYYKDHPDVAIEAGSKISQWYKDNPDKVKEKAENFSKWCKDNKEYVTLLGKQHSERMRSNPDKISEQGKQHSQWFRDNADKWQSSLQARIDSNCIKRCQSDYSKIIEYVHPDYLSNLHNGLLKVSDRIKTKCPICGEYADHMFGNVFRHNKNGFRYNKPPLCKSCKNSLTSSNIEQEIADYVSVFYLGECIKNSKNIISPLELDLYYPEKKVAIEFNGDYWHSSEFKHKNYHYNKFKSCLEKEILLVSIFESEWNNKKDEIKQYLKDLFGGVTNKISYIANGVINNNYPDPNVQLNNAAFAENFYIFREFKVFTCGYSMLHNQT